VDPAFSDTKNKKSSIVRKMVVRPTDTAVTYLDVEFQCNEEEANSLRTCVSSFVANMSLVCDTMREFGN
jgi:hypothetical protein